MSREFSRFLIGGGINTALTYLIFWGLSLALHHALAYSISFIIGIALSYLINALLVFHSRVSAKSAAMFPLIYLIQYIFGLAFLSALVDAFGIRKEAAMVLTIIANIPLTFFLTRRAFRGASD